MSQVENGEFPGMFPREFTTAQDPLTQVDYIQAATRPIRKDMELGPVVAAIIDQSLREAGGIDKIGNISFFSNELGARFLGENQLLVAAALYGLAVRHAAASDPNIGIYVTNLLGLEDKIFKSYPEDLTTEQRDSLRAWLADQVDVIKMAREYRMKDILRGDPYVQAANAILSHSRLLG